MSGLKSSMTGEALEIWILSLMSLNLLSAGAIIGLIFLDNRHNDSNRWKIPPQHRTPIFLAVSIFAANIMFCVREVNAFMLEANDDTTQTAMFDCSIYNEISWLGIWCPILVLTLRLCFIAAGDIFKRYSWAKQSEMIYVLLTAVILTVLWVPSHILSPSPCSPFIMLFSAETNSLLGLAGGIILISLFVLISVSVTIILHKSKKDRQLVQLALEAECGGSVQDGQPDPVSLLEQRVVEDTSAYYSIGLCCQYAFFLPNFWMITSSHSSNALIYLSSFLIHTTGIILLLQYLFLRDPTSRGHFSVRPHPCTPRSVGIIRQKLQRPRPMNPKINVDKHAIRPYTTCGGGSEYENIHPSENSMIPPTEKRPSDKTINDSRSILDQGPSLDSSSNIPQESVRPPNVGIGGQGPGHSTTSPLTVSSTFGSPKPDRECANLSQRPYTHCGLSNEYQSPRKKEKLPFFDMSTNATSDETWSLLRNSPLSNRSPQICEIHPLESTSNAMNPGAIPRERRTNILSKSKSTTIDTIPLGQRPSTSPSQFSGSSMSQMQNQQFTAAHHRLSITVEPSAFNVGHISKSQPTNDQTAHQNRTSIKRDGSNDTDPTLPSNYRLFNSYTPSPDMGSSTPMREFEYGVGPTSNSQSTIETTPRMNVASSIHQAITKEGSANKKSAEVIPEEFSDDEYV